MLTSFVDDIDEAVFRQARVYDVSLQGILLYRQIVCGVDYIHVLPANRRKNVTFKKNSIQSQFDRQNSGRKVFESKTGVYQSIMRKKKTKAISSLFFI